VLSDSHVKSDFLRFYDNKEITLIIARILSLTNSAIIMTMSVVKGKKKAGTGASAPSCDWGGTAPGKKGRQARQKSTGTQRVRLHRFDKKTHDWSGVKREAYKKPAHGSARGSAHGSKDSWADVVRHTLIGTKGESTDFHLRYFEVAPGGNTSLESHEHEHVVVCIRGEGLCRVRRKDYEIGFMDVIYIPPGAPHQLRNRGSAPFGFFCIVDAERDRPVLLEDNKRDRGNS